MRGLLLLFVLLHCAQVLAQGAEVAFRHTKLELHYPFQSEDALQIPEGVEFSAMWPEQLSGWVSSEQVLNWLHQQGVTQNLTWKGAKKIWVQLCYGPDVKQVMQGVRAQLSQALKVQGLKLDSVTVANSSFEPCYRHKVSSSRASAVTLVSSRWFKFRLEHSLENGAILREQPMLAYQALVNAAVAKRNLAAKHLLTADDLKYQWMPWTGLEWQAQWQHNSELVQKVKAGETLVEGVLQRVFDVMPGQKIKVRLKHGAIQIESRAVAKERGNKGQWINILVEGSNKLSRALVMEKGVVHVSV